ncbi:hypothetical protein JL721_5623 [Aureococcus anophagefferens]|nr:hypothetical protein JL721_5623 [Aureococcus anophagefferens]
MLRLRARPLCCALLARAGAVRMGGGGARRRVDAPAPAPSADVDVPAAPPATLRSVDAPAPAPSADVDVPAAPPATLRSAQNHVRPVGRAERARTVESRPPSDPMVYTHVAFLPAVGAAASTGLYELAVLQSAVLGASLAYHATGERPGALAKVEGSLAKALFAYGALQTFANAPPDLFACEAALAAATPRRSWTNLRPAPGVAPARAHAPQIVLDAVEHAPPRVGVGRERLVDGLGRVAAEVEQPELRDAVARRVEARVLLELAPSIQA